MIKTYTSTALKPVLMVLVWYHTNERQKKAPGIIACYSMLLTKINQLQDSGLPPFCRLLFSLKKPGFYRFLEICKIWLIPSWAILGHVCKSLIKIIMMTDMI